jgi:hypothetical protein
MSTVSIEANVKVEERSRTFTPDQVGQVLNLLTGVGEDDDGEPTSIEAAANVKFGTFPSPGAARSAGVTLNRLLLAKGAQHKYAVTTQQRDGVYEGIILNKKAKDAPPQKGAKNTGGGNRRRSS